MGVKIFFVRAPKLEVSLIGLAPDACAASSLRMRCTKLLKLFDEASGCYLSKRMLQTDSTQIIQFDRHLVS